MDKARKIDIIDKKSKLWIYMPEEIRGLILDGEFLLLDCHATSGKVSDYSYLVFPFSKAYEGFLKQIFLDMGLIREEDFYVIPLPMSQLLISV